MNSPTKVLIVDDSAFARSVISQKIGSDPELEVVGQARDGLEALERIKDLRPNVITMDVSMPRLDGLATLERIMAECPTPVVMLSALTGEQTTTTMQALELGAVDFFLKPSVGNPAGAGETVQDLIMKLKVAAGIPRGKLKAAAIRKQTRRPARGPTAMRSTKMNKVVAIGSSTGGPRALAELLPALPRDLPASLLVIQHMPAGFTGTLAKRLDQASKIDVKEAQSGDSINPGQALLAPGGYHMTVTNNGAVELNQDPPVCGVRPSVDVTLDSVAKVYGVSALGVILTGMGSDGTQGAARLKAAGGWVAVEHESTCAVYGMPKSVIDSGSADVVAPLTRMAREIIRICGHVPQLPEEAE